MEAEAPHRIMDMGPMGIMDTGLTVTGIHIRDWRQAVYDLRHLLSFSVVDVQKDANVTIHTSNFPSNVMFNVKIGRSRAAVMIGETCQISTRGTAALSKPW